MKAQTWQAKVQQNYNSLDELKRYDEIYNIVERCGFETAEALWNANPWIGGSVNPEDFGLATKAIAVLISPTGEEFFDAYGPMTKDRSKATQFVSMHIAEGGALNRFGRSGKAFWESERQAEQHAYEQYKGWTYRIELVETEEVAI